MVESRDYRLGITRHEFSTVSPEACRRSIEELDCIIKQSRIGEDTIAYQANFAKFPIDIYSTPTRTILFCSNKFVLSEFEKHLNIGAWEYDDSTRLDYLASKKASGR